MRPTIDRTIDDGFGNVWERCEPYEDCGLELVRPGKVQCERCQYEEIANNPVIENIVSPTKEK